MNGNTDNQESVLIIRFQAPGSVFFEIESPGTVFPAQLIVAGNYLLEKGKELTRLAEQMQRQQEQRTGLAKPESKIVIPR